MNEHAVRPAALRPVSVGRAVASFLLVGLVALSTVAVLLALAQRRDATAEAIRDARTLTHLEATDVVGPLLSDRALTPGTPDWAALDRVVRRQVLGSHIVRVKVWDETGRIAYSDDTSLIGMRFALHGEELDALRTGRTAAELSKLSDPENVDERRFGTLLQVYLGVRTPGGQRLLFETYQPYHVIADASRRMLLSRLPVLLTGLVLLYLLQAPLAYRMARRLKASQDDREGLLLSTLAASDRERATIAADLHDGVVQGLAGASFSLAAAAERSRGTDPAASAAMSATAADLRRWVRELRSVVVTITPPALHAQGLAASLEDLASTLEARGLGVAVEVSGTEGLPEATEALVFRAAQEAVRNIVRHADALTVRVLVRREQPDVLVLRVADDGRGVAPDDRSSRRRGSVGLDLLGGLVAGHGGTLQVDPRPDGGTELVLRVPVTPAGPVSARAESAVPS